MMARVPREFSTVVLDTNVVVAALLWDGVPRALLKLVAAEQSVAAVVSPALIAELERVLQRAQLAERVRATGRSAEELVSRYREIAVTVTPSAVAPVVVADSDDDHVLALAGRRACIAGDHRRSLASPADRAARRYCDCDSSSSPRVFWQEPVSHG